MKIKKHIRFLTETALIAALYVALTQISFWMGLDKGAIQLRLSEALCVLSAFTFSAVPGLGVGCFLANLLTGSHPLDILFGSLATLCGALGGYLLRPLAPKKAGYLLLPLPTVIANLLVVPPLLIWVYGVPDAYYFLLFTVGMGELLSAGVLGTFLYLLLCRRATQLFDR